MEERLGIPELSDAKEAPSKGSTSTQVFLVSRPGDERDVFGTRIVDLLKSGCDVRVVCCGRAPDDQVARDRGFLQSCMDMGLHPEAIVFAFERAAMGSLSPWPWAEQLSALLGSIPGAEVWAYAPTSDLTTDRDARALGLAALFLWRTGAIQSLMLVGSDGQGDALRALPAEELSFERCAQEWTDAVVEERVSAQRDLGDRRATELEGQLATLRSSKSFRLGNALALPWRMLRGFRH